ncbi:C40 family peptidase [Chryseobacterium sp. A301]
MNTLLQAPKENLLKSFVGLTLIASVAISCGTSSRAVGHNPVEREIPTKTVERSSGLRHLESKYAGKNSSQVEDLLKDAHKYLGAPYKYGGDTSSGFDCSGFTLVVFEQNEYKLPRRSSDQALTGDPIEITQVKPGDLLFFATGGGSRVSHVGIVHDIGGDGEVKFIHASTSKGVIISSLNETYWNKAYLHAQKVL